MREPSGERLLPGAHPTECSTCPISGGCYWICLRADDWAEQELLAAELRRIRKSHGDLIELFKQYDAANNAAWSYDGQLGAHDNPSGLMMKKSRALWDKADEARALFTKAIGIEPTPRRGRGGSNS